MEVGASPDDIGLFPYDVVTRRGDPTAPGLVSRVFGESDSSESEEESDEEEEEEEELPQGHASICWLREPDALQEKIDQVRVLDRFLVFGDTVCRTSDPLGQSGVVLQSHVDIELELGNWRISGLRSEDLRRVQPFHPGMYVVMGPWLGKVEDAIILITVTFADGSKCVISDPFLDKVLGVYEYSTDDEDHTRYYPGQLVRLESGALKEAEWVRGRRKSTHSEGTVVNVECATVTVKWLVSNRLCANDSPPHTEVSPEELILLEHLTRGDWQVGDWTLPPLPLIEMIKKQSHSSDSEMDQSFPVSPKSLSHASDNRRSCSGIRIQKIGKKSAKILRPKGVSVKEYENFALRVVSTETKLDVLWQDGSISRGVESTSLFPVYYFGDHDFWPGSYVMEKDVAEGQKNRIGYVKNVDSNQKVATVNWSEDIRCLSSETYPGDECAVSVYGICNHSDYDYKLGDIVISLPPGSNDPSSSVPVENVCDSGITNEEAIGTSLATDVPFSKDECDVSWVGQIVGFDLPKRALQVKLGNGKISVVTPLGLYAVNKEDSDDDEEEEEEEDLEDTDGAYDEDDASWATVDEYEDEKESCEEEIEKQEEIEKDANNVQASLISKSQISGSNEITSLDNFGCVNEVADENKTCNCSDPSCSINDEFHNAVSENNQMIEGIEEEERGRNENHSTDVVDMDLARNDYNRSSFSNPFSYPLPLPHAALGALASIALRMGIQSFSLGLAPNANKSSLDAPAEAGVHSQVTSSNNATSETLPNMCEDISSQSGKDLEMDEGKKDMHHTNNPIFQNFEEENRCSNSGSSNLPDVGVSSNGMNTSEKHSTSKFQCFDVVKDASDHHFFNNPNQGSGQVNDKKWSKRIQKEWEILKNNLPETIWVRIYEERMDLMRAAIVGPASTPYWNCLFFFDIFFPPEFPHVPPSFHYHSFGLRLNPNLYENGRVCLSLLNTWNGKGTEVWQTTSSILQVLISIQGLVLVSQPYYNEAGFDKQMGTPEGEKNSQAYTENAFLLTCKSIVSQIRNPPKHFENLIRWHFGAKSKEICGSCHAYSKDLQTSGASAGPSPDNDNNEIDMEVPPEVPIPNGDLVSHLQDSTSSSGFKWMLNKVYPKLLSAFDSLE